MFDKTTNKTAKKRQTFDFGYELGMSISQEEWY